MRKTFAVLLSVTLSLFSAAPTSAATKPVVKLGAKCLNRHAATKVADKYFVCTLLNSKMTWQPSIAAIEKSIWLDLQKRRNAQSDAQTVLDIHYSPTVNRKFTDAILTGVNSAAKLWQSQHLPKTPLPTFFFSEKDRQWFIDEMKSVGLFSDEQVMHFDDEIKRNGDRASWAGVTGTNGVTWMLFMVGTGRVELDRNIAEVPAHEYTHLAQFSVTQQNQEELTCWQVEGGASFYGSYLGSKTAQELADSTKERNGDRGDDGFEGLINTNPKEFEKMLDKFGPRYNHSKCGPDGAFQIGSAAYEYLYTLKSHDGVIEFMKNVSAEGDYQKAVQITYGKPWPTLRKEIANYIRLVVAQN